MAARYLLDSNILSAILKSEPAFLLNRMAGLAQERFGLSAIVLGELLTGAEKIRDGTRLKAQIAALTQNMEPVPFDASDAAAYSRIRAGLERRGEPIGSEDLFIAAQAVNRDFVLVTANLREFERVPGLKCENWLR